jgi:DNA polymerase
MATVPSRSARLFFPERMTLEECRRASRACQGCELHRSGTQTVFGEGRPGARVFLVGEQPGHEEDLAGRPFVGPAGSVLDEGLAAAGIDREEAYVTNVVKHFKWIPLGRRRLHQKPGAREIAACFPWLEKEIELLRPEVLVCLGATAAQALLGREFRVSLERGRVIPTPLAPGGAVATIHPSAILRRPTPEDRRREMERFVRDLGAAARRVGRASA